MRPHTRSTPYSMRHARTNRRTTHDTGQAPQEVKGAPCGVLPVNPCVLFDRRDEKQKEGGHLGTRMTF
jgi:hypothetical protein